MATKINVRNFWHHFWTQFCDALSHGAIHFVRSVSSSTLKMGAFYWLLKNFSQYNFAIIVHLPLGGVIGKYYLLVDAVVHCSQHLCQSCQRGPPGGLEGSVLVILDCKLTLVTFWKYGFTYFDFNLQGDQKSFLEVCHIETTPFVRKKSCWVPQDTQGH